MWCEGGDYLPTTERHSTIVFDLHQNLYDNDDNYYASNRDGIRDMARQYNKIPLSSP